MTQRPLQGNGSSPLSTAVLLARGPSQWEKRQGQSWRRSLQSIARPSAASASCLEQLQSTAGVPARAASQERGQSLVRGAADFRCHCLLEEAGTTGQSINTAAAVLLMQAAMDRA